MTLLHNACWNTNRTTSADHLHEIHTLCYFETPTELCDYLDCQVSTPQDFFVVLRQYSQMLLNEPCIKKTNAKMYMSSQWKRCIYGYNDDVIMRVYALVV